MNFQIFLITITIIVHFVYGGCVDETLQPIDMGDIPPCPFYSHTPVCCRQNNIEQMVSNYRAIDATFGQDGGGCDICGANLKRFWCIYTCDPQQSNYIQYNGKANVTDPGNKNKMIEVQLISLTITPTIACEVFSSCSRTSFVGQVSAMQTPGGFFMFLGEQAISQGQQFITFKFQEDNAMIMEDSWKCNHQSNITTIDDKGIIHYWDQYGYELKQQCGCNTCAESCDANEILYVPTGVLYGFEYTYVISIWIFVLLFAFGITLFRNYHNNRIVKEKNVQLIQTLQH